MGFTSAEVDLLRITLLMYKANRGVDGKSLPWKTVVERIKRCPSTKKIKDAKGEYNLKEEALRRFATRYSVPDLDKLEDIKLFLIHNRFLKDGDLTQLSLDTESIIAVQNCLAVNTEDMTRHLSMLGNFYETKLEGEDRACKIHLSIYHDPSKLFFRVEETTVHKYSEKSPLPTKNKDKNRSLTSTRYGFGFIPTSKKSIHLFLRGGSPNDKIIYYESSSRIEGGAGLKEIDFIRIGEAPILDSLLERDSNGVPRYFFRSRSEGFSEGSK